MFTCIERPRDQKCLYFTLKKTLSPYFDGSKIPGIYAIWKDEICLYVGMSTNLAGRLATHLSGKYESADKIQVFVDEEHINDLIPSEKWLMQYHRPMENLLVNFSEKIDERYLMPQFKQPVLYSSFDIIPDDYLLMISVGDLRLNLLDTTNIRKEIIRSL